MAHPPAHTPEVHEHADSWHHHESVEGLPQQEHGAVANTGVLIRWLVVIFVALIAVVVSLTMYFESYATGLRQERVEFTDWAADAQNTREAARENLRQYRALSEGAVQIPLDQAKDRVAERYSTGN